jgi:hypothetical protein
MAGRSADGARSDSTSLKEPFMNHSASRRLALLAFLVLIAFLPVLLLSTPSPAQESVRIRGKIERIDGDIYVIRSREGNELKVKLAAGGGVAATTKASLVDVKPGSYIGVSGLPQPDGSQRAVSVHIFDESMRGLAEGHIPWDLLPQSTMTNATVASSVAGVNGQELLLKYKDGEKKIIIPPELGIVSYAPGEVADLKAGASVFIGAAAKQPDGTYLARRIGVGRDVPPPM